MATGDTCDVELDLDAQWKGLIAHGQTADDLRLNPRALRPCVAKMMRTPFVSGGIPDRSLACSVIASELVKLGFERPRIEHEIMKWNKGNRPELKYSRLRSTIDTAVRQQYNYSCRHHAVKEFCVGFDLCPFAKGSSNKARCNHRDLFAYHWQRILSTKAKLVYWLALPELEKRKGLKPGSDIYESHAEIAKFAGVSRKSVKGALIELERYGLIKYKPGRPRKWEGKSSEIRRIFPIAKPPREEVLRVTKDTL